MINANNDPIEVLSEDKAFRITIAANKITISVKRGGAERSFSTEKTTDFREAIIGLFDEGESKFSIYNSFYLVLTKPKELNGKLEIWLVGDGISTEESRNVISQEAARSLKKWPEQKVA